jgi:tetratricopeptide (TPR) repeat protein
MSFERWTDGRRVGSLYDNGGGIKACKCGKFYRLKEAIDMGMLAETQIQKIEVDENGNEIFNINALLLRQADESFTQAVKNDVKLLFAKIRDVFSKASRSESTKEQIAEVRFTKEVNVKVPLSDEQLEHIPRAIYVSDAEMHSIIKDKNLYSEHMVLAARERYRMHINDKFREPFIEYCKDRSLPVPSYKISTEHRENTQAILSAYLAAKKVDWLGVGDLYRELGEFKKALECFKKIKSDDHNETDLEKLTRANKEEVANPLPI